MKNEAYERLLTVQLEKGNYEEFLRIIASMPISKENLGNYLSLIKKVLRENRWDKTIPNSNSEKELLEAFDINEKEESYFEIEVRIKNAIRQYLEKKLNLDKYSDEDKDIIITLESFESEFNI